MLKLENLLTSLFNIIKQLASFIREYISDQSGIRTLYILILLVPNVCLILLYHAKVKENRKLIERNEKLQQSAEYNYLLYTTAKDSIRATIFEEYIRLAKSMNELKDVINESNDNKSKEIIKYSNKVEEEIKKIE